MSSFYGNWWMSGFPYLALNLVAKKLMSSFYGNWWMSGFLEIAGCPVFSLGCVLFS
jgi:hypothetical protein